VLCDDVAEMRELIRVALEDEAGAEVVAEADNGKDGARLVAELQPDVVVLDLSMPEMDGLEAIPLIASWSPRTAIVIFSGFAADRMIAPSSRLGADRYVEKGAGLAELTGAIREAVEARRRGVTPPALPVSRRGRTAEGSRRGAWFRPRRRS
jgi:DNA-binding NarL/FixJ family response regulator